MNTNMIKKKTIKSKYIFLICTFLFCLLLSACGSKREKEIYEEEMSNFYNQVIETSDAIDNIDTSSEDAISDLLIYLNQMNQIFSSLTSISVPDEYATNLELSQRAAENMQQAVDLYNQAFSADSFDAELANTAKEYYDDAMNYASYIGKTMMGYTIELN